MFELADRLIGIYKTNNVTKSVAINPSQFMLANAPTPQSKVIQIPNIPPLFHTEAGRHVFEFNKPLFFFRLPSQNASRPDKAKLSEVQNSAASASMEVSTM
jgi:hypothetical protein